MRTLQDKKYKNNKDKSNNKQDQQNNTNNKSKEKEKSLQKQNIRKTVKTSFKEDFRYDIQVLPHSETSTVTRLIEQYIQLMSQQKIDPKHISKFYIITGIKSVMRALKKPEPRYVVFIFFDPKYNSFNLLINAIYNKSPCIIMKPDQNQAKIKHKLGIKKLSCLLFRLYDLMPNLLDQFFPFTFKCRISIPTLYQPSLPTALVQETTVIKSI